MLRADLIKVWKILRCGDDLDLAVLFEMAHSSCTRGHVLKNAVPVCRIDVLRRFREARKVLLWNALPTEIIRVRLIDSVQAWIRLGIWGQVA